MQTLQFQPPTLTIAPSSGFTLNLVGGWRINQPYCRGGLAIDFATMRCWTAGPANNPNAVFGYQLGAVGSGTNVANWPQVNQSWSYGVPFPFTGNGVETYACGLHYEGGKLWISPKEFYTASGSYPTTYVKKFTLSGNVATLTDTLTFAGKPMQAFGGGFIKGGPTTLIGCGCYESGYGMSGPCWMDQSGNVINEFPAFNANASLREKRPNNYSTGSTDPNTWFTGPTPESVWCAGRVFGGGVVINGKTCFFVNHGTGPMAYTYQNDTFSATSQRYIYQYAPGSHWGTWQDFPYGYVKGIDINAGFVYVLFDRAWGDACPSIGKFSIN